MAVVDDSCSLLIIHRTNPLMVMNDILVYKIKDFSQPIKHITLIKHFKEEIMEMSFLEDSDSLVNFKTQKLMIY